MKKLFLLFIPMGLILTNCSKQNESTEQFINQGEILYNTVESTLLTDYEIPETDIDLLQKLGFSGSPVQIYSNFNRITNKTYISYLVEGDIEIKSSHLVNMVIDEGTNKIKQYRTNIIADPGTYKIMYVSYSLSYFGSNITDTTDSDISDALNLAIENYNDLNLEIQFERVFLPSSFPGKTGPRLESAIQTYINESDAIVVRHRNSGEPGGSAGFPRSTFELRPYRAFNIPHNEVFIDLATLPYGTNVLEHVLTHEIGHCIGLRHTNYALRNCVDPDEGGAGSIGAIHIPGTPTANQTGQAGLDNDSVMLACADDSADGEFSAFDIIALEELW